MAYKDDHKKQARDLLTRNAAKAAVTRQMLVAMSVLGYKGDNLNTVAGLVEVGRADTADGYDCIAVFHAASGNLVLVNRGAEGALSQRDWIEGAEAVFGKSSGPLGKAIDFFEELIGKLSRDELVGAPRDDVHEIRATGHSWGGALADAQIALGPTILERLGYAGLPFSGVGIASAGFANAIEKLSRQRNLPIAAEPDWSMSNYVRWNDPIRLPGYRTIGAQYQMPSIWAPQQQPAPRGGLVWTIGTPIVTNHDAGLYFDHFKVDGQNNVISEANSHYYLTRRADLVLLDDAYPSKIIFGTIFPDEALGV